MSGPTLRECAETVLAALDAGTMPPFRWSGASLRALIKAIERGRCGFYGAQVVYDAYQAIVRNAVDMLSPSADFEPLNLAPVSVVMA